MKYRARSPEGSFGENGIENGTRIIKYDRSFQSMDITLLSKHRQGIMGLAILMIVFHHLPIHVSNFLFNYIQRNCGFGVDLFFLVSGIGLFYSYSKDSNLFHFYLKRFIRVVPLFVIIVTMVGSINFGGLANFVCASTLEYWINVYWFIPAILLCYLIYPLWHHVVLRGNNLWLFIALFVLYTLMILLVTNHQLIYYTRYYSFLLGAIIAKNIKDRTVVPRSIGVFTILTFAVFVGFTLYVKAYYSMPDQKITYVDVAWASGMLWKPYFYGILGGGYVACLPLGVCEGNVTIKNIKPIRNHDPRALST